MLEAESAQAREQRPKGLPARHPGLQPKPRPRMGLGGCRARLRLQQPQPSVVAEQDHVSECAWGVVKRSLWVRPGTALTEEVGTGVQS